MILMTGAVTNRAAVRPRPRHRPLDSPAPRPNRRMIRTEGRLVLETTRRIALGREQAG